MDEKQLHNYGVWDRLFLLLYPCDESVTNEEVDADLARVGIDMKPAFDRLHRMVAAQRAKLQISRAKETRQSITDRIRDIVAPKIEGLRIGLRDFIGKSLGGQEQLAYFHKLESAATEQDLQSLLDDLEKLAAIRQFEKADDSKAK